MVRFAALLACGLFSVSVAVAQVGATPAPEFSANPKYAAAMAEAKDLAGHRRLLFALDAYKKACKAVQEKDPVCLKDVYEMQVAVMKYKDAVETALALEAIATTPAARSSAEVDRGRALFWQAGEKAKPDVLQAADAAFKAAIVDNPKNANAHYLDGYVLAKMNQMDAARQQFKACLSCISPKDTSYVRTEHLAENPVLATEKMAPPITVTALDGTKFNLDEMGGRVVLIDFWAMWCGPCNRELPTMKKIAKEFAGEPLVIISVSWDTDEAKWKEFVAKNEMTWVQYRDADHALAERFGINSIPHYFTIDADGVLTAEMLGEDSNVEGKLKKLVAKAKAEQARAAASAVGSE